ncbi:MAG: anthranilate phosphoribosyltransferase [Opitutales bacterium]|nr:anthranilate phosphoribosyltransferase [Opitutales bacterium]
MNILPALSARLEAGENLSRSEARSAALDLSREDISLEHKKRFLKTLTNKGETTEEVATFAATFRDLARKTNLEDIAPRAIDIVGTGGSKSGSYNISSVSAMCVAVAGVPVIKHGNRAITSQSGSADFLGALGVPRTDDLSVIRRCMDELNFTFLFAPSFHPAFKEIVPVRKALAEEGMRTIFNILGPLINPARPAFELLGVFSRKWVHPLAGALGELGLRSGLTVHGRLDENTGMDEFSSAGENHLCGFGQLADVDVTWTPDDLGLSACPAIELCGRTADENVATLHELVRGKGPKGLADTISLNAGAALWIAGEADDIKQGTKKAYGLLTGGSVAQWLEKADRLYKSLA